MGSTLFMAVLVVLAASVLLLVAMAVFSRR
jgi:hypothetical protein